MAALAICTTWNSGSPRRMHLCTEEINQKSKLIYLHRNLGRNEIWAQHPYLLGQISVAHFFFFVQINPPVAKYFRDRSANRKIAINYQFNFSPDSSIQWRPAGIHCLPILQIRILFTNDGSMTFTKYKKCVHWSPGMMIGCLFVSAQSIPMWPVIDAIPIDLRTHHINRSRFIRFVSIGLESFAIRLIASVAIGFIVFTKSK